MKSKSVTLVIVLFALLVVPASVLAQGENPPPPCCNKDGAPAQLPDPDLNPAPTQGVQITVTDATLSDMGISRSDFINRLAASVYPAGSVDLMIPSTSLISPLAADAGRGRLPEDVRLDPSENLQYGAMLIAVQVKRLYQVPRARVSPEIIETIDQLYITDGRTYMEVRFSPNR